MQDSHLRLNTVRRREFTSPQTHLDQPGGWLSLKIKRYCKKKKQTIKRFLKTFFDGV